MAVALLDLGNQAARFISFGDGQRALRTAATRVY